MEEHGLVDPAVLPRDLLQAGDLETLPLLDGLDEVGRLEEGLGRAGVQPSGAAAEALDVERCRPPSISGSDP